MNKTAHTKSGSDHVGYQTPSRMLIRLTKSLIPATLLAATLAACTTTAEKALGTNVPLSTDRAAEGPGTTGVMVWRSPDLAEHERAASAYYIPDATVYHGRGSGFADLTPAQIDQVAAQVTQDVRKSIGRHFKIVKTPGPGAFTVELVLIKVAPPGPAYISNGPYDWSASVVGMPNAQTTTAGQMTVAGKFIDAVSNKLLVGFVAPVSPQSMDLASQADAGSTVRFAQRASTQFASDLTAAIIRQRQLASAAPPR